jgi:Cysteine-rich CPXCG
MRDEFPVTCPFCGEQLEIYIEPDARGTFVQDCEVCCNPCGSASPIKTTSASFM